MKKKMPFVQKIFGLGIGTLDLYLTRYRLWDGKSFKFFFHKFHRGDYDRAFHDHPWDFWTFPLTSYREDVLLPDGNIIHDNIVPAFKWSYRPATYAHIVKDDQVFPIYTFIITRHLTGHSWGFFVPLQVARLILFTWELDNRRRKRKGDLVWVRHTQYNGE